MNNWSKIALVLLVLTAAGTVIMGIGLTMVDTQGGSGEFTEATEEIETLEKVNNKFPSSNSNSETATTTLLLRDSNALKKQNQILLLEQISKIKRNDSLEVTDTSSVPGKVAAEISGKRNLTVDEKIEVINSTAPSEVSEATEDVLSGDSNSLVSKDYTEENGASATRAIITHNIKSSPEGPQVNEKLLSVQKEISELVDADKISVTGQALISSESKSVINDSLILVLPATLILVTLFLVFSYRSILDIGIGILGLVLSVIWTFGSFGWLGLDLTQFIIVVPVILLAVGVDFGIHVINRYREEQTGSVEEDMKRSLEQLLVAFGLVTITTAIGFGSNITSPLPPLADYGIAAVVGIFATFFIFGIFVPSLKYLVEKSEYFPDDNRSGIDELRFVEPVLTSVNVLVNNYYPVVIFISVLLVILASVYGAGVSTEFTQDTFQPPTELPAHAKLLPGPFEVDPYTATESQEYITFNFPGENRTALFILVSGNLSQPDTLEHFNSVRSPSELSEPRTPLTIINSTKQRDPSYARIVNETDTNGNGVPDTELNRVYNPLLSEGGNAALRPFMTPDKQNARVIVTADVNTSQSVVVESANSLESQYEKSGLNASSTGLPLVLKSVSDLILKSIIRALIVGLLASVLVLVLGFYLSDRRPAVGVLAIVPIVVSISLITATMELLGIPFNAVTSLTLSTALGLGLDYSIHIAQRFTEDENGNNTSEAIRNAVVGTGGAVTGSIATTVAGIGTLSLALLPVLSQFGLLIAITLFYTYASTILVMPSFILGYENLKMKIL